MFVQFVAGVGLGYLGRGESVGWASLGLSALLLVAGALLMALWFERLTRALIAWTGSDEDVEPE